MYIYVYCALVCVCVRLYRTMEVGPIYLFWRSTLPAVLLTDPDAIKVCSFVIVNETDMFFCILRHSFDILYKEVSATRAPKPSYWQLQEVFGERLDFCPNPLQTPRLYWVYLYFFFISLFRLTGRNLLTIPNYEGWKDRRRVFDPAFSIRWVYTSLYTERSMHRLPHIRSTTRASAFSLKFSIEVWARMVTPMATSLIE